MAPIYHARRESLCRGRRLEAELITPMMQQLSGTRACPRLGRRAVLDLRSAQPDFPQGNEGTCTRRRAREARHLCLQRGARAHGHHRPGGRPRAEVPRTSVLSLTTRPAPASLFYGQIRHQWLHRPRMNDRHVHAPNPNPNLEQARADMMRLSTSPRRPTTRSSCTRWVTRVGERHNFISSSDAFNYRPQYWQLRTNDGANATNYCDRASMTPAPASGRATTTPSPRTSVTNLIWMWMHSSVMDYAGEYTQDFLGLGGYDMAAHRMFYGENVAVFNDASYAASVQDRSYGHARQDGQLRRHLGHPAPVRRRRWQHGTSTTPSFSEQLRPHLRLRAGRHRRLRARVLGCRSNGAWDPLLDGFIVPNEAGYLHQVSPAAGRLRAMADRCTPHAVELRSVGQLVPRWSVDR